MFCSRCGKKVLEYMLFCPFCGAEIVIPEQEAGGKAPDVADDAVKQAETERFAFEPEEAAEKDEVRVEPAKAEAAKPEPERATAPKPESYRLSWEDEPEAAEKPEPRKKEPARPSKPQRTSEARRADDVDEAEGRSARARRAANTYVPDKAIDAGDMFMDDISDDYDDYDSYEARRERERGSARARRPTYVEEEDDEDDYEDEERGGFLMRHIRGLVGLLLFLVLVLVVVLYGLSDAGQRNLARINATLPLNPKLYASLGKESYAAEDYRQAGVYYERALAREAGGEKSYDYAQSAVMAYIAAKSTDKATEMLKTCIALNPNAVEPYVYLMNLYPDASNRSVEIDRLIRQGYQMTGDARLNPGD